MAFSEQTSVGVAPERALGRRPIMLAQLPRIDFAPTPRLTRSPSDDGYAERVIASAPPTSYFIDGRHTWQTSEAIEHPNHHTKKRHSPQAHSGVPSATLFRLHSLVAPYAGLIVAMALIACAGLLYWIISGAPAAPLDYRDIYNIGQDGFGTSSLNFSEPAMPTSTPASTELALATEQDAAEPWISEPITVEMPPVEKLVVGLPFPQTANPAALDFSLLRRGSALSVQMPTVGERTVPHPLTPTIRR